MAKVSSINSDVSTQTTLERILCDRGHEFEVFKNMETFLNEWSIESSVTEVLILDVSGLILKEISAFHKDLKRKFPELPLLVLVDAHTSLRPAEILALGAFQYLHKNCLNADLIGFVELALRKRASSEAEILLQDTPTLDELAKRYMSLVLKKTRGRKERAAKILGINRRTLYRKEREYGWVSEDADSPEENEN